MFARRVMLVFALLAAASAAGEDLPEAVIREEVEHEDSGTRVSYLRSAQGEGQRVILVHGTPGSARAWDDFVRAGRAGFDPVAIDRPGFGETQPRSAETRLPAQAAVLEPLLRGRDGSPSVLVGHSLGAAVVLELAARFPEALRGVVAVAGALDPELEHGSRTQPVFPMPSVYQVIVYTRGTNTLLDDVRRVLSERCGMSTELAGSMQLNQALDQAPSTGALGVDPDVPLEPEESPSGWSLPFTWIILVGFLVVAGLFWRSFG